MLVALLLSACSPCEESLTVTFSISEEIEPACEPAPMLHCEGWNYTLPDGAVPVGPSEVAGPNHFDVWLFTRDDIQLDDYPGTEVAAIVCGTCAVGEGTYDMGTAGWPISTGDFFTVDVTLEVVP